VPIAAVNIAEEPATDEMNVPSMEVERDDENRD